MHILWWIKWIAIVLGIWTVVGLIAGLLFGQFVKWGKNRQRNGRNNPWHPFNGK